MLANISQLPTYLELQRMSRFCIALFRRDRTILSAYVASNLFEMIIDLWLEIQDIEYDDEKESLINKIYKLNLSSLAYNRSTLSELRLIRNDIIHGYIHALDISILEELILFIWEVLDEETYFKLNKNIQNLDLATAYYWVRDFEALDTKAVKNSVMQANSIEFEDFTNLYKMADKFKALAQYISTNKKLGKYGLSVDNISEVNSTSAYIWLAITTGNYQGRQKIETSSVSILATPDNLRIYIDFGGLAFNERKEYFEFLKTLNINNLSIGNLVAISVFDIEWYSYIENKYSIDILNSLEKATLISSALNKLEAHGKEAPISWNKLLIGYILNKQTLSFEKIWDSLDDIITIYNKFQIFKDKATDKNINEMKNNEKNSTAIIKDLSKHFS